MASTPLDERLSDLFQAHGTRFWHADNLKAVSTHLRAGHLLSRQLLMSQHGETPFVSDASDRQLGVLERVFGNFYDFGQIFARGACAVPNIYGPISFCFRPEVYEILEDIIITKNSILNIGAQWRTSALKSEAELMPYFRGSDGSWEFAEISAANVSIPLSYCEAIVVEPLTIGGTPLVDIVRQRVSDAGLQINVKSRPYRRSENLHALDELVAELERDPASTTLPGVFASYPSSSVNKLRRWISYFQDGTLDEIAAQKSMELLDEHDDRTNCEICDPGPERPPALVDYDTEPDELGFVHGNCDWCNSLHLRCDECGDVIPIWEGDYGTALECSCGRRFEVDNDGIVTLGTESD